MRLLLSLHMTDTTYITFFYTEPDNGRLLALVKVTWVARLLLLPVCPDCRRAGVVDAVKDLRELLPSLQASQCGTTALKEEKV
jgi:hypothetical protein